MENSVCRVFVQIILITGLSLSSSGFADAQAEGRTESSTESMQSAPEITILSTMVSNFSGTGEWGFSALIRTGEEDILFDTGYKSDTVLNNARALNLDLSGVEKVILSHFHTDHTGGLFTLRSHYRDKNPEAFAKVFVGKGFFEQRYNRDQEPTYGFGGGVVYPTPESFRAAAETLGIEFIELSEPYLIGPGMHLTGPIKRIHDEKNYSPGTFVKRGGTHTPDRIEESQVLGMNVAGEWLLLSGCGHAGIVNAAEKLMSIARQPIVMGIGGFHLFIADDETLNWTAEKIRGFGIEKFVGAHCTGVSATYRIGEALDLPHSDLSVGAVGTRIDSNLNIIRASIE